MSSAMRKPPPPNGTPGRRGHTNPPVSPSAVSRSPTPSSSAPTNGIARTRSVRGPTAGTPVSARAAAKRPVGSLSNLGSNNASPASEDVDEDDAKAETAALIEDLKIRLEKTDSAAEEYQKQLEVVQSRLDDALNEQARLEELVHESSEKIETLENNGREAQRQARELEGIYEAEKVAIMQEKEEMAGREEEMHSVIQRLKESLTQRDMRPEWGEANNSSPIDREHFAPPSVPQRSNSKNNSKLLLQKDKLIESLRLELAEAQIKLVESDNLGGTRLQGLEKQLLETRMANARLMEDNESFQLLLGEKTLNGDFTKADFMQMHHGHGSRPTSSNGRATDRSSTGLGSSLADELESATEGESENYRRLEAEAKSLKDQNKALTLYINNMIGRLLQHKDFEAILDKTPNLLSSPNARPGVNTEKELPPPPPPKQEAGQSILQRAKSVAIGTGRARPRPMSYMPPPTTNPSMTDDPSTAPSIPLARSQSLRGGAHRRSNSEWSHPASVVNQMYRGPSPVPASGTTSPGVQTPRAQTSFFAPPPREGNPNAAARVPSTSSQHHPSGSSSNSTVSDYSGEVPSPPHSHASISSASTAGGKIEGNKLRPLRLVQENSSEAGAGGPKPAGMVRKGSDGWEQGGEDGLKGRGKRNSWMGWFSRGKDDENLSNITAEPVKEERDF
ncbi:hypothetical protein FGG08_006065 [Glutinoglossum americanum]|uniref:M protein, serotype 2.1 n=1 Tax=Glutinoglossum americanum TaxID=1670608 RepID=A0A9P8HWU9_9PEZI|nr:hypothetical protein FGG08_006065 [Glutinoglossum americanum]